MKEVLIFVSGAVQGIGYRYFVKVCADKRGIVGLVRNLANDKVEILAQGIESNLKNFLNEVCTKHTEAKIKSCEITWHEPREAFNDFRIEL